jgi:hypothetical protein
MSIFEALGMTWVIFTSTIATIEILYLALLGLKAYVKKQRETRNGDVLAEVKEIFRITR